MQFKNQYVKSGEGIVDSPPIDVITIGEYCEITGMKPATALKRIHAKGRLPGICRIQKSCGVYLLLPIPDEDLKENFTKYMAMS